jgi:alanyl-tRNA synthetase
MTGRLYYSDPYLTRFSARVVEHLDWEGQPAVVLDQTAFYPTGGGQPHDVGTLNDTLVVDVVEREVDGAVVHILAERLEARTVEGVVDWERRFDLMQQHTGQHVLSAAFLEAFDATTVGFHLSDEYATIDLDRAPLSAEQLAEVETFANAIIFQNRPVMARFVPDEEVPTLLLRKPLAHKGPVRIVEIPDCDCSACGGTHVRAAGEVGLLKITRSDRRGAETRVEFLCGGRALADYAAKNAMLMNLAAEFTVGHWEVADLVHRLADDLKETRRELRHTRDALLDAEAAALWHQAERVGQVSIVRAHFAGRTADDLKHLAQRLIVHPQTVALLGTVEEGGGKASLAFARSTDLDLHMGQLVRQACEILGGRGGGRPEFAQGGGPDGAKVAEALEVVMFSSLTGLLLSNDS